MEAHVEHSFFNVPKERFEQLGKEFPKGEYELRDLTPRFCLDLEEEGLSIAWFCN